MIMLLNNVTFSVNMIIDDAFAEIEQWFATSLVKFIIVIII